MPGQETGPGAQIFNFISMMWQLYAKLLLTAMAFSNHETGTPFPFHAIDYTSVACS